MAAAGTGQPPLADLWALIERRMGVCPAFFRQAGPEPAVAWGLFRLAESAYLDSPMPALFKEMLFTYLSRICEVRYCVARHCAFLLGRGYVAGDPACPPLAAEQAQALLEERLPPEAELPAWLRALEELPAPLADWPDPASDLGRRFRIACALVFIDPCRREDWLGVLRRLLGPGRHERLMQFLGFIRTAHFWTEVHPELALEPDVIELFYAHEGLARLLLHERDAPRWRIREALWESEERFQALVEPLAQVVWETDARGMVVADSPSWRAYTGQSREDWLGEGWAQAVHPDDRGNALRRWREAVRDVIPVDAEVRLRSPDGSWRWTNVRAAPVRDADGSVRRWVGMNIDITERKRAEAALRAGEDRLRRMLNIDVVSVLVFDESGTLVDANDAFLRLTGYTREQVAARALTWQAMTPAEYLAESERQVRLLAATGRIGPYEKEYFRRDGSRCWMLFAGASLGDGTFVEYCIDVTDHKRTEAALRASEERLRLALGAARMGIWTWDIPHDTQTRDANLNLLLGLEPVESRQPFGEFLRQHIHPDDRAAVATAFDLSIKQGHPLNVEFRIVRPDGSVRWLRDQGDIFRREEGAPYMAGACMDVTDLKEAEAALRASEERLRLIVEGAIDYAIFTLDANRRVTSWSPGARAIFEYTETEILGRSGDLLFTPEDRVAGAAEVEARTALRDGRAADERWHLRKDGSRFYASGVLTPLGEGGSRGFVKIARDLTERKRVEDALREARDELERRVAERTAELSQANSALQEALAARQELLRRVVTAQEDERRRVSRELHDGLGQELTALILGLKALEGAIPEGSPGRDRLVEIEAIVGRIGREAHDLAVDLRPTALDDIGLGPAVAAYVTRWSERTGTPAEFQPLGLDAGRLPPEVETAVYRVVQEALNNVTRHAGAGQVSVIVERSDDGLTALVEDNGRGFDPAQVRSEAGRRSLGLLSMRERVGLVGGTLLVESGAGEGTTVRARFPLRRPIGEADHER